MEQQCSFNDPSAGLQMDGLNCTKGPYLNQYRRNREDYNKDSMTEGEGNIHLNMKKKIAK
jgi:hypothetical protein